MSSLVPLAVTSAEVAPVVSTIQDEKKEGETNKISNMSPIIRQPASASTTTTQHQKLPISQQSTILSHRIQKTCKTVQEALGLMKPYFCSTATNNNTTNTDWEEAWYATIQICGKQRDYQQAYQIVQQHIPKSDRCRSLAIAICGRCHQIQLALSLVYYSNNKDDTPEESSTATPQARQFISTPAPYNAAIAACGTNRAWKDALRIVQSGGNIMPKHLITTLTCNAVLTALTKSQRGQEALLFLQEGFDQLGVERDRISYHHTISALLAQGGGTQPLDQAIHLVLEDMPLEAQRTSNPQVLPNMETYDRLIANVVAKRNSINDDGGEQQKDRYNTILQQLQQAAATSCTNNDAADSNKKNKKKRKRTETADAASVKASKKRAKELESLMMMNSNPQQQDIDQNATAAMITSTILPWDFCKWDLPKRGKGKTAYWELGVIQQDNDDDNNIIVGLHPNRNPSKNGIQLWFFRENDDESTNNNSGKNGTGLRLKREKLGYLLMINTPKYRQEEGERESPAGADAAREGGSGGGGGISQFLGLRVTDDDRRKGLAKIFVAIWLQCCLDANLQPTTGKMNKPLLCLILQHSYQFQPIPQSGGVRARLLPPLPPNKNKDGDNDNDDDDSDNNNSSSNSKDSSDVVVRLTTESSSGVKHLAGALSPRDVQEQKVQFVVPTEVEATGEGRVGRPIDVGGLLQAPAKEELEQSIQQVLQSRWKLSAGILRSGDDKVEMAASDDAAAAAAAAKDQAQTETPLTMTKLFLGV